MSSACAVHCALTPVLLAALPAVASEQTESTLRRALLLVGFVGVGTGTALHRNWRVLFPLAVATLFVVASELVGPHSTAGTILGFGVAGLLISAHALNTRACNRVCGEHCAPGHFWGGRDTASASSRWNRVSLVLGAAVMLHAVVFALLSSDAAATQSLSVAPSSVEVELAIEETALETQAPSAPVPAATPEPAAEAPALEPSVPVAAPPPAASEDTTSAATPSAESAALSAPASAPAADAVADSAPVRFDDVLLSNATSGASSNKFGGAAAQARKPALGGRSANGASAARTGASAQTRSRVVPSTKLSRSPAQPSGLGARIQAHYPIAAREQALSGSARVRLKIEKSGMVSQVQLLSEAPQGAGFGAACAAAVRGSHWSPPLDESGDAVATWIRFTCHFGIRR